MLSFCRQVARACGGSLWTFTELLTAFNDTLTQVRKAAGMFLYCLKQTARRITADEGNCHFQRIAEDEEFYSTGFSRVLSASTIAGAGRSMVGLRSTELLGDLLNQPPE